MSFKSKELRKQLEENNHRIESGLIAGQPKITVFASDLERLIIEVEALEQQLKAARKEAFIAGANHYYLGPHMQPDVSNEAEEYANSLEGK